MEAGRAIDTVVVKQSHRRHLQLDSSLDQVFRMRGALKKAEGTSRMKLNVSVSHRAPLSASSPACGHEQGSNTVYFPPECVPQGPTAHIPRVSRTTTRRWPARDHMLVQQSSDAPERQTP